MAERKLAREERRKRREQELKVLHAHTKATKL